MEILLFSVIAGIGGTGLGGLLSVALGNRSPAMICWMLSFASGVMTSIVCFGLIPESIEIANVTISVAGMLLGIAVIMLLNRVVDKITATEEDKLLIHNTHEELYHENPLITGQQNFVRSGILMLVAIGLHNIPEGMAIGAGGSHDIQLGTLIAIMIALHNIPEGMAIASPLLAGGIRKGKILWLTALSGAPTFIGGLFGVLMGNLSDAAIALSLSMAGGAMLYVVFGEIIPQSVVMTKNRIPTLITLGGIMAGLIISRI